MLTDRCVPFFHPEQIEAMHTAYERACAVMGLGTKASIVTERVAVRIVDFAKAGEFDANKLTDLVLADFNLASK
jgi:hypothetical protein